MIQRFGSLLQLNVHDHSVIPDGVFADDADGRLTLFELPPPNDADVEAIALGIAKAVTKALAQVDPPAARTTGQARATAQPIPLALAPRGRVRRAA